MRKTEYWTALFVQPTASRAAEARTGGLVVASGPLLWVLSRSIAQLDWLPDPVPRWAVESVPPLLALIGGLALVRVPLAARFAVTAGLLGFVAITLDACLASPGLALALWLGALMLLRRMWVDPGLPRAGARRLTATSDLATRARATLWMSLGNWVLIGVLQIAAGPVARLGTVVGFLIAAGFGGHWLWRTRARPRGRLQASLLAGLTLVGWGLLAAGRGYGGLGVLALASFAGLLIVRTRPSVGRGESLWSASLDRPASSLVLTFFALCVIGTLLLGSPACSSSGERIALIDAGFTAVSAVCVTGLIVLDTPVDFSGLGQAVILVLIQLGGLGIMTFATAIVGVLGRRLSLRQEGAMATLLSHEHRGEVFSSLRKILLLTLVAEALGAVVLGLRFAAHGDGPAGAVWRGLFTSVSAFCNAGFALQSDSLIPYQHDPWVLHVVALLIIVGGLSPAVVLALPRVVRRRRTDLQIRLVLVMTTALLFVGTAFILVSEGSHALADLSWPDRLHNAWFYSVTLRTAGFNSFDLAACAPGTLTLSMLWMFLGGSPGGTAGGIKTTTAAILLLAVGAAMRGRDRATAFGRTLSHSVVYKSAAIVTIGIVAGIFAVLGVQITQELPAGTGMFEVVSALGTVGLTLGATPYLDDVGKLIIMGCMFAGRIGPLTLFIFLAARFSPPDWELPEESVDVG